MLLREIIGVNRAIIFLRKPSGLPGDGPLGQDDRWLRSACAIGHDQSVLQHFALSLGAGIGGYLHRQGRILRATSHEAHNSREIAKEFQLLGAQVAIPILDRESLIGVVVFDERLTGEAYANEELAIIFHMLEEVGLAIRNTWLHDQLVGNHDMVADILGQLGAGCVVIGSNLTTLHANMAACRYFRPDGQGKGRLEFSDLPQELGSRVFTVIKSGHGVPSFRFDRLVNAPGLAFRVSILPFRAASAGGTNAALLIIEDVTEHERAQRLEIEASNLRLVKSMAEHLAHEIGNSLVPLSTHQQLLKESINDPEFQESLSTVLASGVKRISRLANQMIFLARGVAGRFPGFRADRRSHRGSLSRGAYVSPGQKARPAPIQQGHLAMEGYGRPTKPCATLSRRLSSTRSRRTRRTPMSLCTFRRMPMEYPGCRWKCGIQGRDSTRKQRNARQSRSFPPEMWDLAWD